MATLGLRRQVPNRQSSPHHQPKLMCLGRRGGAPMSALSPDDPLYLPERPGRLRRAQVALRAFAILPKDMAHGIAAPLRRLTTSRGPASESAA